MPKYNPCKIFKTESRVIDIEYSTKGGNRVANEREIVKYEYTWMLKAVYEYTPGHELQKPTALVFTGLWYRVRHVPGMQNHFSLLVYDNEIQATLPK